jgi:dipeptidyl aminopeptidase/acylaminoacyl peptidase
MDRGASWSTTFIRNTAVAALFWIGCGGQERPPSALTAPEPAKADPAARAAAPTVGGQAPKAPVPLVEYFKIGRVQGASISYDEKLVAYSYAEGDRPDSRPDVWVAPIGGGAASQVTHVTGRLHSFSFSPTADELLFEADKNGDELPHIYATNAAGDEPKDLMGDYPAGRRTEFIAWEPNGGAFLFRSNLRDERYLDLYEYDVKKAKAELLWRSSGKLSAELTTRDGKRIIVQETIADSDSNLYLVERGSPDKSELLTKHDGDVLYSPVAFSKDGKTLFLTSDQEGEFQQLYSMDLGKKTTASVMKTNWDVENADFSRGWKYFWTLTNEDGSFKLRLSDLVTHKELEVPPPPAGGWWEPLGFSRSDRFLAVNLRGDASPSTVYLLDLKEGRATRVIDPLPPSLKDRRMSVGSSVKISSFDGRSVPAFVYRPEGVGAFPAVIDVHGGPTSQSYRDFNRMRQYLVSKGYVVLVPNVRGSTGYGKSYTKLDNMDLGGGPLKDVVACKGWLVKNEHVDASKVVVMGASYGGYMALAAATFTPKEFAANVDFFGVSDMKSLVESFPPYWQTFATYIYKKFGDPKNPDDAKYQHDRSPLNFVDKIERPLLVIQGDKDVRVKKDQSDRMVEGLKTRNVPVHYLVIPNEGHGFSKNENLLMAFQAADRFMDRYLFNDTSVDVLASEGAKKP